MALPPLAPPLATPVYFLSDAHLGAVLVPDKAGQREKLDLFLDQVAARGRTLVLAGDVFDFWYEWRYVIPKDQFHLLHRLRDLIERGIAVHYLAGNHDFRLRGFLQHEIGLHVHADTLLTTIAGEPVFIFHGDGVLARDRGYRFIKRVLRNPTAQRVFSWLHPDLAMRMARGTSVTSRAMTRIREEDDQEYLAFARRKFTEGFRAVVMGHTHRPVEHVEDGHTYVNLGDWITEYSYGVHDGTRLRLERLNS